VISIPSEDQARRSIIRTGGQRPATDDCTRRLRDRVVEPKGDAMTHSKQQKPQTNKPEKGELSEERLKKVSGGDLPTAVERRGGKQ
jgi:hypothetical protein